ncbi:FAD-binding oxidoreductase [Pikeienuella piscinae]|uniref:FAD-binding oxidoreductase n=1 Tax=Pikeienuella piscinae TaxID=2748098 RepID=A0A7M3T662_9RHOB|nr:FAD-binding oxidoreductase [Pikeienuella piscinae]QIE57493.1 FAD-binding oxidoreductase [Pikeienuella piscinae]
MNLRPAAEDLLAGLRDFLGPPGWRAPDDAPEVFVDDRDRFTGRGALVARPGTTAEVAEVVRRCVAARYPVVPVSGGTGLVGGHLTMTEPAPVILSLQRMNRIRAVDAADNAMIVEAGAILKDVQDAAEAADRLFPLSLASEGSCRIGGNLSSNAGGVNTLRYGNARDLCLGVEAVLPDGTVFNGLKRLRKDNMGYDLRHLLIGAEGTLGVITAAALKLFARPAESATAWLAVPDPEAAVELLHFLRPRVGDVISAFELIDVVGFGFLEEAGLDRPAPLDPMPKWSVLVECGGRPGVAEALETALGAAFEAGLASDGVIAQSQSHASDFWAIRETIPVANRAVGAVSSHDISVPVARAPEFIERATAALGAFDATLRINCFGHVGDGNLHFNVYRPKGADKAAYAMKSEDVKRIVNDLTHAFEGSVGAEHGVGRAKTVDLVRYGDPGLLAAMRAIKAALDPHGVMNPGAVLAAL